MANDRIACGAWPHIRPTKAAAQARRCCVHRCALDLPRSPPFDRLWCNARIKAVPFYERNGFAIHGGPFEIAGIGTHYLMHRALQEGD